MFGLKERRFQVIFRFVNTSPFWCKLLLSTSDFFSGNVKKGMNYSLDISSVVVSELNFAWDKKGIIQLNMIACKFDDA